MTPASVINCLGNNFGTVHHPQPSLLFSRKIVCCMFYCQTVKMNSLHFQMWSIFKRQKPEGANVVKKVPAEILDLIFDLLSTADQICFALTCKSLHSYCLARLTVQNKRFSQLVPTEVRPALFRNMDAENRPRVQLVCRLQNRRWRYCDVCWKLHRPSAWRWPLTKRQSLSKNWLCRQYAGRVELCPCLTITFPDLHHLIETVKHAEQQSARCRYYNGLVKNSKERYRLLQHACTFKKHPAAHLRVTTSFVWDNERELLQVESRYKFDLEIQSFSRKESQFTGIKTPLRYSRRSIKKWLLHFFDEAGSNFSGWHRCLASAELSHPDKNRHKEDHSCNSWVLTITIWRELGSAKWLDLVWLLNSHRS